MAAENESANINDRQLGIIDSFVNLEIILFTKKLSWVCYTSIAAVKLVKLM